MRRRAQAERAGARWRRANAARLSPRGRRPKGGKIVIAHSNWSSYAEGERWTVVFDIVPASGQHILMDGTAGRDYQPGRFWRERERLDDYRDHAAHDQGIRRERHCRVRPLAQGHAVCHVDRRICRDHAQGQQRRLCEFVADRRPQDGRDWLPGAGAARTLRSRRRRTATLCRRTLPRTRH